MKSLEQVEPRTDVLKLSGDGANIYIISQPGSYYLTTNVLGSGPSQNGILIATNHVTLDLNGFSVLATAPNFAVGISIAGSCTNIVVRHGMVSGWEAGDIVSASASSQNVIFERLNLHTDTGGGIVLRGTGAVRDCNVGRTGGGVNGISCFNRAVISNCTVHDSGSAGIYVVTNCVVSGCYIENSVNSGIQADVHGGCEITGNTCVGNNRILNGGQGGIALWSGTNRVDGNRVIASGLAGIQVPFSSSSNNVIIRNVVSGNGTNNYVTPGNQIVGPIITTIGTITNLSPWANFSF